MSYPAAWPAGTIPPVWTEFGTRLRMCSWCGARVMPSGKIQVCGEECPRCPILATPAGLSALRATPTDVKSELSTLDRVRGLVRRSFARVRELNFRALEAARRVVMIDDFPYTWEYPDQDVADLDDEVMRLDGEDPDNDLMAFEPLFDNLGDYLDVDGDEGHDHKWIARGGHGIQMLVCQCGGEKPVEAPRREALERPRRSQLELWGTS